MIKNFEKYRFDIDSDVAEEYVKIIISKYIDLKLDGKTLENIYYDTVTIDHMEEQQDIIRQEIFNFIKDLYSEANKIRTIEEIDASKYNL